MQTEPMRWMAGKYRVPETHHTMAMIGTGAQCEFQAIAFRGMCGANVLRLNDVGPRAKEDAAISECAPVRGR